MSAVSFKRSSVLCLALLISACGAPKARQTVAHDIAVEGAAGSLAAGDPATGSGVFRIDPARSSLRLLVYRAGSMARLGHNHVISNGALGGWVKYSGNARGASFLLRLAVGDFVVDDAAMRAAEGADFAAPVAEEAKAGTRQNMLSEALLDAGHFPNITLSSIAVSGATEALSATVAVSVAGHATTLVVPFVLFSDRGGLHARGSVTLRQSGLGLVPFSVMLGALQVQDEFTVKFELSAVAT